VLDSEELGDILMLIDVDVEVLKLAIVGLDGVDEHGLEDVARAAPGSASLDHYGPLSVLQGVLPVLRVLHLADVLRLVGKGAVGRRVRRTAFGREKASRELEKAKV